MDKALECYKKSLDVDPNYGRSLLNIGIIYNNKNLYSQAIEYFDEALKLVENNKDTSNLPLDLLFLSKGEALYNLGKMEEAINCYDRVLELNPKNISALLKKALYFYTIQRYEEALLLFDKATEYAPEDDNIWEIKGIALYMVKNYNDALICINKALKINPNNDTAKEYKVKISQQLKAIQEQTSNQYNIKNYNTLQIYINNKIYKGKKLLHQDGTVYASLEDLKKDLYINNIFIDEQKNKLYIDNILYPYNFIKKGKNTYVSITTLSIWLEYKVDYDQATNILDISSFGVISVTNQVVLDKQNEQIRPTINTENTEQEVLTLLEWNRRGDYIVGIVKNNTDKFLSYVKIEFNLYDINNNQVDSIFTNMRNLEPHGVWKFEALILSKDAVKAKCVNLEYSY